MNYVNNINLHVPWEHRRYMTPPCKHARRGPGSSCGRYPDAITPAIKRTSPIKHMLQFVRLYSIIEHVVSYKREEKNKIKIARASSSTRHCFGLNLQDLAYFKNINIMNLFNQIILIIRMLDREKESFIICYIKHEAE